jgi:hypothetical protein
MESFAFLIFFSFCRGLLVHGFEFLSFKFPDRFRPTVFRLISVGALRVTNRGGVTQSDSKSLSLMDIEPAIYLDPRISPSYLILAKSNLLPAISFLISSLLSIPVSYSIQYRFLPKYSTGDPFRLRLSSSSRSISVDMVRSLQYPMLFS